MGNFNFSVPSLGNKFIDYRQPIIGDSFNWSWIRPLSQPKYLTIHHSAGPDTQTPDDIARYHVQVRGWGGVGYHFIITKDGTVYYVGDLTTARANVLNFNQYVIGICLIGTFMNGKVPTNAQLQNTHELCAQLLFRTPELVNVNGWEDVVPHKALRATECPGDTWDNWRQKIITSLSTTPPTDTNRVQAITTLYHTVLGRDPDQSGLNFYVTGNYTYDQIRQFMVESAEHQQILNRAKNLKIAQQLADQAKQPTQNLTTILTNITNLNS
jgi:hypothetical protein